MPGSYLGGVSCAADDLCALTDHGDVLISRAPAAGLHTWTATDAEVGPSISCPTVSLCVSVEEAAGRVVTSTNPTGGASAWMTSYVEGLNGFDEVSCTPAGLCVVTSYGGNGSDGNVIVSTDPAAGADAWTEANVYGDQITRPDPILPLRSIVLTGVSCASPGFCVVVDINGRVVVGTPAVAPINTSAPVLSGTPAVGQALSCSEGSWSSEYAPTIAYQWIRDGAPIINANASSYTVQAADQGHSLACQVIATNSVGSTSATSSALSVPAAPNPGGTGNDGGGPPGPAVGVKGLFAVAGITSLSRQGTVRITLTVSEAGTLAFVGTGTPVHHTQASRARKKPETILVVAPMHVTVSRAGRTTVTLKPTANARALLAKRGKLGAMLGITYTPKGGQPASAVRNVTFILKRRH